MKPYSQDVREKIIRALEARYETREEMAARFTVSPSVAVKLWRRWRETGAAGFVAGRLKFIDESGNEPALTRL